MLYNLFPGFHDTSAWEEFLVRNRSPPYINAEPEITHRRLGSSSQDDFPQFLILSSDGFADLCGDESEGVILNWAKAMIAQPPSSLENNNTTNKTAGNMALQLLRRALGGDDRSSVSMVLTLDMDVAWIDDTAIVVHAL